MTSKIRSIQIFNRKSIPDSFSVGSYINSNNDIRVSKIEEQIKGNTIVYDVYVTIDDKENHLYKRFTNCPVEVTFEPR